jgi:transcription antitermination factor NusG
MVAGTDNARALPENDEPSFWFALTVKSRHEKVAAQHLRLRGLDEFLPLHRSRRRWSDRTAQVDLPLFPGYLFCRFGRQDRWKVLSSPGITSVVGFGDTAIPVEDSQIESIRSMALSGLPLQPCPYLKAGEAVCIDHGPLQGVRGIVVREKNPWRVVVTVELLQRSVSLEIDREMVSSSHPPSYGSDLSGCNEN